MPGATSDLLIQARSALLDALEALADHRDAVILIGAQALYLHAGAVPVALAEATKDSDIAVDPRVLGREPLLEKAMTSAGFHRALTSPQPGTWLSRDGVPVDLMVPEALAGEVAPGRRGARIPPHGKVAARRAVGLEAAVVDHAAMEIAALAPGDGRTCTMEVAGPAALLVAKLHKLGERASAPDRLADKDAHDLYRLLVAVPTERLGVDLVRLCGDELAGESTRAALAYLDELFAVGPRALGSKMAGRAEEGLGDPETVAASVAVLAADVLTRIEQT